MPKHTQIQKHTQMIYLYNINMCRFEFSNCWTAAAGSESAHLAALTSLDLLVSGLQQPDPTHAAKERRKEIMSNDPIKQAVPSFAQLSGQPNG